MHILSLNSHCLTIYNKVVFLKTFSDKFEQKQHVRLENYGRRGSADVWTQNVPPEPVSQLCQLRMIMESNPRYDQNQGMQIVFFSSYRDIWGQNRNRKHLGHFVNSCVMKYALATTGRYVVDEADDVRLRWSTASWEGVIQYLGTVAIKANSIQSTSWPK